MPREPEPVTREQQLEAELYQAIDTVEFLHGCLTDPVFCYAYPEMTLSRLEKWRALLPERPEFCLHSCYDNNCESCKFGAEMRRRLGA